MKTDTISAAYAYRLALQRVLKAKALHEARQAAVQALDISFDAPSEAHISVASGFGFATQQPFVTLSIANPRESANPTVQLVAEQARAIAMQILDAADAAVADGFLVGWVSTGMDVTERQAASLLNDFRVYRDKRREGGFDDAMEARK